VGASDVQRGREQQWRTAAWDHVGSLISAERRLRFALDVEDETTPHRMDRADGLTEACRSLSEWLTATPTPAGHEDVEVQLSAAAAVLRNAASSYRAIRLTAGDSPRRDSRVAACRAALELGTHHIAILAPMLLGESAPK